MAGCGDRKHRYGKVEVSSGPDNKDFGTHGAKFNTGQTRGFPRQKIAGHAAVGIEELRCTGGACETTTQAEKRQVEVVASGPTD
jgi:hypothetical protein